MRMKPDTLKARIEYHIAELRAAHRELGVCHAALDEWHEESGPRHALRLDLRRPQHQSLVSGPACAGAEGAVQAAFERAAHILEHSHA
jgi:hypothetical protein